MSFPEPPTKDSLRDAHRCLEATRDTMRELTCRIDAEEAALAQLVRERRNAISELQEQRAALETQATRTRAYLSPIRRLPLELLREIFAWSFELHPSSAWVLAAVSRPWRKLALRMPLIWSKIRLLTTHHASADTVRLWLERSGDSVPLDIEIFLRVAHPKLQRECAALTRHRRSASPLTPVAGAPWNAPLNAPTSHYIVVQPPPLTVAPIVMPPSPTSQSDSFGSTFSANHAERPSNAVSRVSMHWGHIAFFYLVEQMHRWERFIFRFDKQFTSMGALKSINGDAPMLKEFEVSSAEAAFFAEWPWLPNNSSSTAHLPKLRSLTLQHTPFKWSSPMFRDLHIVNLRGLPTSHLPIDRILHILTNNPQLKSISLHFQGVLPAILPLANLTLPHVTKLSLGGSYLLTQLLDSLTLPNLESLVLDIEARDALEDCISALLTRSNRPPVHHLAIAYTGTSANAATFYYGPSGLVVSWTALLADLPHLRTLNTGGTALEPLLTALGPPEDDPNQPQTLAWACPRLEKMGLRSCHVHGESIARMVQLVEARNPTVAGGGVTAAHSVGGVTPARIKSLEFHECNNFGEDVMTWLRSRIAEVVYEDPAIHDRSSHAAHPYL